MRDNSSDAHNRNGSEIFTVCMFYMNIQSYHYCYRHLVYNRPRERRTYIHTYYIFVSLLIYLCVCICVCFIIIIIIEGFPLIVVHFGEYFGVNCGFLATSMNFSPMIEFDLVKKFAMGPLENKPIWPPISRWPPLHKNFLMNYCTTFVLRLTAMNCDIFYVGRGTLPSRIDRLFKIQDGRKFQDGSHYIRMNYCTTYVFRLTNDFSNSSSNCNAYITVT